MLKVPTPDEVRAALAPLTPKQLMKLAELSHVSIHTLRKVQRNEVKSPGIDIVAQFAPHIKAAARHA